VSTLLVVALCLGQPPSGPPKVAEVVTPAASKPEEFTARVGQLKRLSSPDPAAKWELSPGTSGADLSPDGKGGCVFSAERPGRYTVACYTSGPIAWVTIVVGGVTPPPSPGPAPEPPAPTPEPATDPVGDAIRTAFANDSGKPYEKKQHAATLSGVWAAAAEFAGNTRVTTAGQLLDTIRKEGAEKQLAPDQLTGTRKAVGGLVGKLFPATDTPMTADNRKQAATLFTAISKALDEVSK
jgi:hypothetical protein